MIIDLHSSFKKSYKKHIAQHPNLITRTNDRIDLFSNNPNHPLLRNHALTGPRHGQRAFSITGDFRIIYYELSPDHVLFIDIGTHNQVY